MKDTLKAILAKSNEAKIARPFLVSYCCLNETTGRLFLREQTEEEIQESGILRVMIPCVARLSTVDLLSPFELGADMVAVIACKENGCFYTGAEELLARRISRVKKFLNEIGVGQDGLQLFKTDGVAEESWPAIWKQLRSAAAGTLARGEGVQEGGSR
jgi:coenzyme F420-reducing hydrogenase delta subunit